MGTVTISPKFQVVIPKEIRERLGLVPGQKVQAIVYGDRIELIPVRPASTWKNFWLAPPPVSLTLVACSSVFERPGCATRLAARVPASATSGSAATSS